MKQLGNSGECPRGRAEVDSGPAAEWSGGSTDVHWIPSGGVQQHQEWGHCWLHNPSIGQLVADAALVQYVAAAQGLDMATMSNGDGCNSGLVGHCSKGTEHGCSIGAWNWCSTANSGIFSHSGTKDWCRSKRGADNWRSGFVWLVAAYWRFRGSNCYQQHVSARPLTGIQGRSRTVHQMVTRKMCYHRTWIRSWGSGTEVSQAPDFGT